MTYWRSSRVTKNQWKYEETYYINQTTNQRQTQRHNKRKETLDENLKVKDLKMNVQDYMQLLLINKL